MFSQTQPARGCRFQFQEKNYLDQLMLANTPIIIFSSPITPPFLFLLHVNCISSHHHHHYNTPILSPHNKLTSLIKWLIIAAKLNTNFFCVFFFCRACRRLPSRHDIFKPAPLLRENIMSFGDKFQKFKTAGLQAVGKAEKTSEGMFFLKIFFYSSLFSFFNGDSLFLPPYPVTEDSIDFCDRNTQPRLSSYW